ncbi:uncharacterized protein LOC111245343 isoform X3 [Varroa destructor]|uniref:Acylamino-acid-releasing enzyme N-terminal domain-containing protein n=1 Tax=Varroa destructor TaxID=109461 RepID=A0A7M7M4X3_VARDE|nr:uncharacterized protein LOC111245343 isoform X3 [Varroa destructor]
METMGSQNVPKFPRKAPVRSAQIHSIYKQAAAVPIPTRGYLSVTNEHVTVTSDWSYIDAESQEQIGFTVSHRAELSKDGRDELGQFKCVQSSTDIHSSIISITTSEGKLGRKAVHRKCLRRGKEVDLLTICALDAEMWTYDPQKYGYHGRILSKGNFASCEWSRQEDKLLFVAERTKASRRHRVEPTVMLPTRTDGPSESNSSDHSKSDSGHPSYFHSFECQQKSSGPSEMNSHPESDAAAGNGNVPEPMSETSAKKEHKFGSSSKTGNYNPESKLSFGASYDNETVCPIIAVLKVPKIFFPPFENDANFDLLAPPEASKGYEEAMEGDADDDESDVNEVDIDEDAEDRVAILEASRHKREKLQLILIHMANVSLGQAVFTPDGKGVVFVGMPNGPPYRPGVSKNRIQRLYHFDVDTRVVTEIGNSNKYIYSPRFSAPGDCLLYLQNESGGTNDKASELYCVDWKSKMAKLITTVPEDPRVDEFPGLYQTKLIPHCTNAEGNLLYVQTQWHFTTQVLQIDLRSRAIMNVSAEVVRNLFRDLLSWELLCVKGDYILLACSSLSDRPNLVVGRKTRCDTGLQWSFQNNQTIYGCPLRNGLISYRNQPFYNYTNDLFEMRPDRQPDLFYSAVHLFPQNRNHPLIVVIHGGPHSAFTTKFSSAYEFLQRLDYGLLLVNYRGSTAAYLNINEFVSRYT